ncbi:hypothetical protein [Streptomyces erythrochromogenes]|uniref:hypothetical protein n=1 Tax=Streptomyces erythrochromogenes TaxID=285574 RepID=UPI003870AD12|nr:hypothetical protein OG364_15785 [Streptomyces erythrochromogenes]
MSTQGDLPSRRQALFGEPPPMRLASAAAPGGGEVDVNNEVAFSQLVLKQGADR